MVGCGDGANFVSRENVIENVLLLEAFEELAEQSRAVCARRFGFGGRIEQAPGIFGIVQVVAKPAFVILMIEIKFLARRFQNGAEFLELELLVLQAEFNVIERGFDVGGICGSARTVEKTVAAVKALAKNFFLFFEIGDFVAHDLRFVHRLGIGLLGFLKGRVLRNGDAGMIEEFLEERVHRFEAVRVAGVIAKQHEVFEKVGVVFTAVEKDDAILQKIVDGRKFFAEEGLASFRDDVFFDVDPALRDLLTDGANDAAARRLQFGEAGFNDVRLLAAFKMLAALANPFLAFLNEVGELIGKFGRKKFENGDAKENVEFDVLVILGVGQRAVEQFGQQLAK